MRHILFYILLTFCVSIIFGKHDTDILTEEQFAEEATKDVAQLLKNTQKITNKHNISYSHMNNTPQNIYKPKSISEPQKHLIDNIDQVFKGLGVKRFDYVKKYEPPVNDNYGFSKPLYIENMPVNNRYSNLFQRLNTFNRNAFKRRLSTTNDQVDQLKKFLDLTHRNTVNKRFGNHDKFVGANQNPLRQLETNFDTVPYPETYASTDNYRYKDSVPRNYMRIGKPLDSDNTDGLLHFMNKFDLLRDQGGTAEKDLKTTTVMNSDYNNDPSNKLIKRFNIKNSETDFTPSESDLDTDDELHGLLEQLEIKESNKGRATKNNKPSAVVYDNKFESMHPLMKQLGILQTGKENETNVYFRSSGVNNGNESVSEFTKKIGMKPKEKNNTSEKDSILSEVSNVGLLPMPILYPEIQINTTQTDKARAPGIYANTSGLLDSEKLRVLMNQLNMKQTDNGRTAEVKGKETEVYLKPINVSSIDAKGSLRQVIKPLEMEQKDKSTATEVNGKPTEVYVRTSTVADFDANDSLRQVMKQLNIKQTDKNRMFEIKDIPTEMYLRTSSLSDTNANVSLPQILKQFDMRQTDKGKSFEFKGNPTEVYIKSSSVSDTDANDFLVQFFNQLNMKHPGTSIPTKQYLQTSESWPQFIKQTDTTVTEGIPTEVNLRSRSVSGYIGPNVSLHQITKQIDHVRTTEEDLSTTKKLDLDYDVHLEQLIKQLKQKNESTPYPSAMRLARIKDMSGLKDNYGDQIVEIYSKDENKKGSRIPFDFNTFNASHRYTPNFYHNYNNTGDQNKFITVGDQNFPFTALRDMYTLYSVPEPSVDQLIYQKQGISARSHGDEQEHNGRRIRRSTYTQAGYTQDPDTCKTYNENLVKLWSDLSKYINITDQPDERALHNIALMIQAYLDHQSTKQASEAPKVKQEASQDKIDDIIYKIKNMLENAEATPDRITKMITKYIKPYYGDVENEECQAVNEESLSSSISLLYRNYLENSECRKNGDQYEKSKELRKRTDKVLKHASSNVPDTLVEHKPEGILAENELYKGFHKGKMVREGHAIKTRRVSKRSRKIKNSKTPILSKRSKDKNSSENGKPRSRSKASRKTTNKRLKKTSLKTDVDKMKCEKYAVRKFTVSLRPVIERFSALFECQLDNTLRSLNYKKVSTDPYYLYASDYGSKEIAQRQKKDLPATKSARKNTKQRTNISHRKSRKNYYYSNDEKSVHNDDYNNYSLLGKYNLNQDTEIKTPAVIDRFTDFKETNDDLTNYNEFFQTPPLYDDYDEHFKTNLDNTNGFPSLIDPLNTASASTNILKSSGKDSDLAFKEQVNDNQRNNNADYPLYNEDLPEEPYPILSKGRTDDLNNKQESSVPDITQPKNDDNFSKEYPEQSKGSVRTFESITDFLKKARDASLQTPEFAVPFALDSNKGYVELTHLIKYPKIIVYRPQFMVKNTMPYDDFLKTVSNFNMSNDEVRLMKIVRHLPDSTVKVLFETEDFDSPLEVRNFKEELSRRSGIPLRHIIYPFNNRADMTSKINKYGDQGFVDEEYMYNDEAVNRDDVHNNDMDSLKKDRLTSNEDDFQLVSNLDSNKEINSSLDISLNCSSDSSSGVTKSISNVKPELLLIMESESNTDSDPNIGSAVDSMAGSDIDSALNSHIRSKIESIMRVSSSNSHSDKLLSSDTNSRSSSNLNFDSYSNVNSDPHFISNSQSHDHLTSGTNAISPSNIHETSRFDALLLSSSRSKVNQWWQRWKNAFKGKVKSIVGNFTSLAENLNNNIKKTVVSTS